MQIKYTQTVDFDIDMTHPMLNIEYHPECQNRQQSQPHSVEFVLKHFPISPVDAAPLYPLSL